VSKNTRRLLAGFTLVLVALNLRGPFTALGPVLPEVMRDLHLSAAAAGLLTTLPVICLGLGAPLAPGLARRTGAERALLILMMMVALGGAARGFGGLWPLAFGGIVLGLGIGMANVLLPGVVKRDFADRTALMTGLYTMSMSVSAALGTGASVPAAQLTGSWPLGLTIWAVPALLAAAVLLPQLPPHDSVNMARPEPVRGLWRSKLAWQVTLLMGAQSTFTYILFAWLPPLLRDRGVSPMHAGLISAASSITMMVGSLAAPVVAGRFRDQRFAPLVTLGVGFLGYLAVVYGGPGWTVLGTMVMGLGQGSVFAIALMLVVLRSPDARVAASLSGMAQGVGYLMAAAGPILVGLLHDWLHGWQALTPTVAVLVLVGATAGMGAGKPGTLPAAQPA
jgi:MFS transporter, CP family, cyanate transporter